jgi:hypothetical protein
MLQLASALQSCRVHPCRLNIAFACAVSLCTRSARTARQCVQSVCAGDSGWTHISQLDVLSLCHTKRWLGMGMGLQAGLVCATH